MTIKETFLNITIVVLLLVGLVVSFMYSCREHNKVKELQRMRDSTEYQFNVCDDSATVYDHGRLVGTIKLDGTLDSLIMLDNQ